MDNQHGEKKRPGFYHKPVGGLSISIIVFGVLCLGLGVYVLVAALTKHCVRRDYNYGNDNWNNRHSWDYRYTDSTTPITATTTPRLLPAHCDFAATYISPGLWGGLMFIASGIIGILAAKRKTTCFIVSMMVMSLVTAATAAMSATAAIIANFDMRWDDYNIYPIEMHVSTSFIALFSLINFILSLIKFGYACRAVCCNGNLGIPKMKSSKQYQPLFAQPMVYPPVVQNPAAQPQTMQGTMPVFPPAQQQATMQPIYLVQGHQVIGMMPPNMQQMNMMGNVVPQPQAQASTSVDTPAVDTAPQKV